MRIAIVNDSPMAAEVLRRALYLQPDLSVCWEAQNGMEALALAQRDKPDLILMDLNMPGMNGAEATRLIMKQAPCAILIVTLDIGVNASLVFDAMGFGALDAIDTPPLGTGDLQSSAAPFLKKIRKIEAILREQAVQVTPPLQANGASPNMQAHCLVAIGASAGGPAALQTILSHLPSRFAGAVVIVQHINAEFAQGMVDWLSLKCPLPIRVAVNGDIPRPGTILIAGTNQHLIMKSPGQLCYTPEPVDTPYQPSIDVFFESVCRYWPQRAVGVLLTGMGNDGAKGLKCMRDKGFHTYAQDKSSSAVYGMPKAAAALDAASEILSLDNMIAKLIAECAQ